MVVYTKCEVVKLWHRLCSLPSTRISSKIFRWLGNLRRKNWVQSTRHLMQNVELPLHAINCTSRKAIGDQAWEAFASHHGLEWKNRVWDPKAVKTTSGGRLSLYRVLKPSPGTEPYVAANVQYAARRVMAGLQMGCLPLEVERGRYTQTPYEMRTCKLCLMDVEDQRHFLLFCPALQQERNLLFKAVQDLNYTTNFMAMDPDQKILHLLAPKANPFVYILQPYIKKVQETGVPSTLFLTRSPFCSVLVLCSLSHGSMIGCHGKARLSLCSSSLGNFSERSAKGGL